MRLSYRSVPACATTSRDLERRVAGTTDRFRSSAGQEVPAEPPPEAEHGNAADGERAHAVPHDDPAHVAEARHPGTLAPGGDLDRREEPERRGEQRPDEQLPGAHRRTIAQNAHSQPK